MSRTAVFLATVLSLVALGATPALAQQQPQQQKPAEERPWAKGVPPEKQKAALELFRTGNTLLKESVFVQAAEKYRQALALWDHPAIHYNLALALLNLDQPTEVYEHLVAAMRYGVAPLDVEKMEHARAYKNLIERQLAQLEVSCDDPGATVSLDGAVLFSAPGRYEGRVRPGSHTFVVLKDGHSPTTLTRTLHADEKTSLALKLYSDDDLTRYRRHWSAWKPWALTGAGVAVALAGGVLHMQARKSYEDFDTRIAECGGCVPTPDVTEMRSKGDSNQQLAVGAYAVGGAAAVTGLVLAFINRPQAYRISPDEAQSPQQGVSIAPVVSGSEGGIQATFRF
ncbi:PEGA domain-containing protein [Hyalangium versicolor]|uniref:PEGA domain-containing protein n=1 Tax=Hyalangium versicolor TaxID=2861190 RepID=UPI001CCA5C0F|nr:PEGA domain-containing protein [Hyalangium versicolor]